MASLNYVTFNDLNNDILNNLRKIPNPDLIIGIPRSGLMAANLLSLYFNVPVTTLELFLENRYSLGHGNSRPIYEREIKNILVVDDSCNSGNSINEVKKQLKSYSEQYNITYFACYVTTSGEKQVDVYCRKIEFPRIFQWNILYSWLTNNATYDLDGVLCEDPIIDDDGEKYIEFLKTAKPKFIPQYTINTIVTCRLEKYRDIVTKWLEEHNVKYKNLIMLPFKTKEERVAWGKHGEYKGTVFQKTDSIIFFESSYSQALKIKKLNPNKLVFSVDKMIFV